MSARCPSCHQVILPRVQNPHFPFCSARCRAVDMGKWLGSEFRIADESADADEDGTPAAETLPGEET